MVFRRINCGIPGLFRACAILCFYGLCLFGSPLCAAVSDRLSVFDQMSLASSSLPCVLKSVLKFWRPSWQLLGCFLPDLGSWGFVFCLRSFFVFLRRDSCWLVLSLAQQCVAACCLSFAVLGGSLMQFRGWCWFCGRGMRFLFAVLRCCPPLLRDVCPSQSVWRCSGFFSAGCSEACFFLSRLFCRSLVFAKASDWWSSFFLLPPGTFCWIGCSLCWGCSGVFLRFVFRSASLSP